MHFETQLVALRSAYCGVLLQLSLATAASGAPPAGGQHRNRRRSASGNQAAAQQGERSQGLVGQHRSRQQG